MSVSESITSIITKHRDLVSEATDLPITEDTRLDAIGIDSLAMLEIIFEIEEKLDIELPFNGGNPADYVDVTVGSLVRQIEAILERR